MATSLNKMLDGSKLYPGYEFLVTVDTYTENVVLVTGFIGSRKYKGALLNLPCNSIRGCVSDNVFSNDFSSKNNFSFTNMAITNYYSHKKLRSNSDVTMFSINKRAKESYICSNCKMKISYFSKKESKTSTTDYSRINVNNSRSDITVLKQTLSYPDISDEVITLNKVSQVDLVSPLMKSDKPQKSLKRKKPQINHVIRDKKAKLVTTDIENPPGLSKLINTTPEKLIENEQLSDNKIENDFAVVKVELSQPIVCESEKVVESEIVESKAVLESAENNLDEPEEPHNYDTYRVMPLSLMKLNHITSAENDRNSEDSLRECPKPKKIWMKMIENEDIEKLNDPSAVVPISESVETPVKNKSIIHEKYHSNRSYKIKQTFYDKVILTIDKRPEKHKLDPPKETPADIYTFTDESEIMVAAQESAIKFDMFPKVAEVPLSVNSIYEAKSSHSSCSKASISSSSLSSSKQSQINLLDENESIVKLEPKTTDINAIKMEPDSTTDASNMVSVISSCENSLGVAFNLSDVVWAKITGYPFWPAKIISFSQEEDTFIGCIEWYAWNEISFIKVNNLHHFSTNFPTKYQKRYRNGKYQEAVKLAKFDCGMVEIVTNSKLSISERNENTGESVKGSDTDSESNAASCTSASL